MNADVKLIEKMDAIQTQIERLERRLWLQEKAAYDQKEIVEAMGLSGDQRNLLDYMKKSGLLHSPILKKPLIYPGEVVRKAIAKINQGKIKRK